MSRGQKQINIYAVRTPQNIPFCYTILRNASSGLDDDFWTSFPYNIIKLGRSVILGVCLLCLPFFLEDLQPEFIIVEKFLSVLDGFIILIQWDNSISIIFGPSEAIHLGIWVFYLPRKYRFVIFLV